ncbi:MAG: ATP synthase F1 subunit delta [Acidobacteriota bacterium]
MNPANIAKRYARALAEVAGPRLERVASDLDLLARVLARRPQLMRFFEDPSVRRRDKEEAAGTLTGRARVGALTRRFVAVLIENRRLAALPAIARAFAEIRDERLGVLPVEATTAVPLSPEQKRRFRESLERMTGRSVRLEWQVDPEVLGGARARIGSRVYDGTLRRQLEVLRERLAGTR